MPGQRQDAFSSCRHQWTKAAHHNVHCFTSSTGIVMYKSDAWHCAECASGQQFGLCMSIMCTCKGWPNGPLSCASD
eukprot:scaffold117034_cov22-Tisochrysis_lutea.AAC.2